MYVQPDKFEFSLGNLVLDVRSTQAFTSMSRNWTYPAKPSHALAHK